MAITTVSGVTISGISSVLPSSKQENTELSEYFEGEELSRIVESTGIESRRMVEMNQTALDLSIIAAKDLIINLNWSVDDIGLLIVVTQTPDYPFPGNAVQLQSKLGLSKSTLAFDINLGCSGFVYGLWQVSQLLKGIRSSRALLIVGDTTSTQYSPNNKVVSTLFGDAISAIAVEKSCTAADMVFSMGSDGAGAPYLIQPNGGAKNPLKPANLFMDGTQVFVFTLREIPKTITECLDEKGWTIEDVDFVVMHQANEMMLQRLSTKIGIADKQMIIAMQHCGNTSSASIPLAITQSLATSITKSRLKLVLSGFGVGWSWGSVCLDLQAIKSCRLIDLYQEHKEQDN